MRFAHLKTHHGFERLRLRGLSGARDEFPSRSDCAEPQDPGSAPYPATGKPATFIHRRSIELGSQSARRRSH